jgi:hypothetical protein
MATISGLYFSLLARLYHDYISSNDDYISSNDKTKSWLKFWLKARLYHEHISE